jgi:hypothetical protein
MFNSNLAVVLGSDGESLGKRSDKGENVGKKKRIFDSSIIFDYLFLINGYM